jgi:hypothetical protein
MSSPDKKEIYKGYDIGSPAVGIPKDSYVDQKIKELKLQPVPERISSLKFLTVGVAHSVITHKELLKILTEVITLEELEKQKANSLIEIWKTRPVHTPRGSKRLSFSSSDKYNVYVKDEKC